MPSITIQSQICPDAPAFTRCSALPSFPQIVGTEACLASCLAVSNCVAFTIRSDDGYCQLKTNATRGTSVSKIGTYAITINGAFYVKSDRETAMQGGRGREGKGEAVADREIQRGTEGERGRWRRRERQTSWLHQLALGLYIARPASNSAFFCRFTLAPLNGSWYTLSLARWHQEQAWL